MTIETSSTEQTSFFRIPFKYPEYGKLWIGQLINNIGSQFTFLALQFLVFSLTGSPLAMGILAACEMVPMLIFGAYAGVLVDRYDRKRIMIISNIIQAIWLFCIPLTTLLPNRILWIYILAFLMGTVNRFFFPSRNASIPKLVPKEDLLAANSLSAATYQLSVLTGPISA